MLIEVVVVYLLGTLLAGALLSSRIKRVSDYLVAGRSLGLALSTASLAAVQIGAGVVLGGAETGASSNASACWRAARSCASRLNSSWGSSLIATLS